MAIICKCRLLSFLLSSGPFVAPFFSASWHECSLKLPTEAFFSWIGTFFSSTLDADTTEADWFILKTEYQMHEPEHETNSTLESQQKLLCMILLYNLKGKIIFTPRASACGSPSWFLTWERVLSLKKKTREKMTNRTNAFRTRARGGTTLIRGPNFSGDCLLAGL